MKDYNTTGIIEVIKKQPILHDHLIDVLYLENGLAALKVLEFEILGTSNFDGQENVVKYLENKIAKIESESDLQSVILSLQKEEFEYKKKIRVLEDQLRAINLVKEHWFFLLSLISVGLVIGKWLLR
jgi:hypothetical protein